MKKASGKKTTGARRTNGGDGNPGDAKFRELLQTSLDLLAPDDPDSETGSGFIDLFAMHGINRTKEAEWILEPGGCMDVAKEFQAAGKIKHIGFSTHAMTTTTINAIETDLFDYVNLHCARTAPLQ